MKFSANGINKLAELEGRRNHVYLDTAGLKTIGIGHLLTQSELTSGKVYLSDGSAVNYRNGLSDLQVDQLLYTDLNRFIEQVQKSIETDLTQNQFDALVIFCFNIGSSAFRRSTLIKKLNAGEYIEVPKQLRRWNRSGGRVIQGLINRREKEIELWNS